MGIRIGEVSSRYELLTVNESTKDRERLQFLGPDEAMRFLQRHLAADDAVAGVRRWAFELGLHHPTQQGFLQLLVWGLMTGELWVAEIKRVPGRLGRGGKGKEDPPKPQPKPQPKPKPKPVAELVVTVKNLFGKPVKDAKVTAGALGSMQTDKDGIADFGKVTPGVYDITAEKTGHGKKRNGPVEIDEKKAVSVPDGSKTEVTLIQHPECANVAFFEGSKIRSHYFGFDHKTNIKAAVNGEYWVPVPAKGSLTAPTNKLTRDEARWVSVAVGKQAEVEIHFLFKDAPCIPCLANTTYQVVPANVAEVVTAHIGTQHAWFKIKGKAKGEATLKVICDGHDIGWFHIWCDVEKTLLVDVGTIVTNRATAAAYNLGTLATYMNEIFSQILVKFSLKDIGTIDLSANAALATLETTEYPTGGEFQDGTTEAQDEVFLTAMDVAAQAAVAARVTGPTMRAGARRLYWYTPTAGAKWGGMNVTIGHPATFIFFTSLPAAYNTGAHELGHSLKLRHPSDDTGAGQFAAHNRATLSTAIPAYAATNTEPASAANPAHSNIMANDPTNLMGYWPDKAARKYLRYHQWKAADRS